MLETAILELTAEIKKLRAAMEPKPVEVKPTVSVAEIKSRTADDVKAMLKQWVAADPSRKGGLIEMFRNTTGLQSMGEVNATNASEVYAKLEAIVAT